MSNLRRAWAEISLEALDNNIDVIKKKTNSKILAVVKADAYGHGAVTVAKRLSQKGVYGFGVATLDEAKELRAAQIKEPILILGYTPVENAEELVELNIIQTCFSLQYATALERELEKINKCMTVHIKIDTGMGRIGFADQSDSEMNNSVECIKTVFRYNHIKVDGIFTHFAISEIVNDDFTLKQFVRFEKIIETLEKQGCHFNNKHCANSAAVMNYPQMHLDMVRPGIILYGLEPDGERLKNDGLKPVMSLKASVAMVKSGTPDGTICYGRTCASDPDKKYATITIGYADGYSTKMSNVGEVIIRGKKAKVCGRVCMDQMVVDVTGIDGVQMGDVATVFGCDGDERVFAEDIAEKQGLINYEVICEVGKRVPRILA